MAICVRAVSRMPATAITPMIRQTPVSVPTAGHGPDTRTPATVSTDGPSTTTSATVPIRYPAIVSHPVRNPR